MANDGDAGGAAAPDHTPGNFRDMVGTFGGGDGGAPSQEAPTRHAPEPSADGLDEFRQGFAGDGDPPQDDGPGNVEDLDYDDNQMLDDEPGDEFQDGAEPEPEQLFGLTHEDLISKLKEGGGLVPDELLDQLKVTIKRDGVEEQINLRDYADGVMMRNDYSRKLDGLRSERQEFETAQNAFTGMLDGWKQSPERAGIELEMLGLDVEAMLRPHAEFYAQLAEMTPREQQLALENRKIRREQRLNQLHAQTEQQRLEATRNQNSQSRIQEQVETMRGEAFKRLGISEEIANGPTAQRLFENHIANLWTEGNLTPEIAHNAAQATKLDLIALARDLAPKPEPSGATAAPGADHPQRNPAPGARPPSPRGVARGSGKAGPSPQQQGGTVDDFRARMERIREGG